MPASKQLFIWEKETSYEKRMEQDTFGIKNRIFTGNDCTGGAAGTYGIGKTGAAAGI